MSVEKESLQSGRSFMELEVWIKVRALKIEIEQIARFFPSEERFRLTDQLIRSIRSVNANLAEGHGRYTFKEQIHFCIIARGSLSETLNHLVDAFDCKYIQKDQFNLLKEKVNEVEKVLNGY